MQNSVHIAENGTILSWNVGGVDLLAPYVAAPKTTDARGGLPLCVPMFSVQQRDVPGSHLPLHGILMYEAVGTTLTLTEGEHFEKTLTFPANTQYAWDWSCKLEVTLTANSLTYEVTTTRSVDCKNQNQMPLSLGFHPYFNTFRTDFSYEIAEHTTHKQEIGADIIDSAFAPLANGESARLTTKQGTLMITPEGYDEYGLCTDNIDNYFCIEPIFQYREYGLPGTLLKKGESHKTSVTLHFEPLSK
jgi:galactose mutarotase-like enzyme